MQESKDVLEVVAEKLWAEVYEREFRGKPRGRFSITREQLKQALGVKRLHASTVDKLQERALEKGLVIIDLDDIFPCIEVSVLRKYRRPPRIIFDDIFGHQEEGIAKEFDDDDD